MSSHQSGLWRRRSVVLAALSVFMLVGANAHAQVGLAGKIAAAKWTVMHQFPEPVTTVEFLDDLGAPNMGFVGTGSWNGKGSLYRTTDRGATWSLIFTKLPGYVSSVSFKDSLVGWLTMMGTLDSCYGTTDGGLHWTPIRHDYYASQALYHSATGVLLLSSWSDSSLKSMNGGTTWSLLPSGNSFPNGYAFSNDTDGVCGTVVGTFLLTHDGGLTWSASSYFNECWQLAAIRTGTTFIAGSEKDNSFHRSDDAGQTWRSVASPIPLNGSVGYNGLTGCTIATSCALFTQSSTGMYASIDSAKSWLQLHGPMNLEDTRFFARGLEVIAGDTSGKLWVTDIDDPSRTVQMTASGCDTARLSIPMNSLWSPGRVVVHILSDTGGHFYLQSTDTIGTTSKDSLRLLFHGGDFTAHTISLTIAPIDNLPCLVSEVIVSAQATRAPLVASAGLVHIGCNPQTAAIHFDNKNCETLEILSATPSSNLFSIAKLDSLVAGSDSALLQFSTQAVTSSRTYSLHVHGHYLPSQTVLDTTIYIPVTNEHPNSSLVSNAQQIRLATMVACESVDTTLILKNNGCDTLYVALGQTGIAPEWTLFPNSDTIMLLPYASDTIHIHFTTAKSGSYAERLRYSYTGPHSDVTIIDLNETVLPSEPMLSMDAASRDLGQRSICLNDTTLEVTLTNSGCDTERISQASIGTGGSFVLLDPSDTILPPGGILQKHIAYHPAKRGPQNQDLRIHFSRLDGTIGRDTTIPFTVNVTRGETILSASASSIELGSLYACQQRDTVIWLKNSGCDTLTVASGSFTNASYSTDGTYPILIPPNSAAPIHVFLVPDTTGHPTAITGSYQYVSDADSGTTGSILLNVRVIYPMRLHLSLLRSDSAASGKTVTFTLVLSHPNGAPIEAISALSFDLTHDNNLLSYLPGTAKEFQPVATLPGIDATREIQHFVMPLAPTSDTAGTLTFRVFLAGARATILQLSNVTFNNTAGVPNECVASIDDSGAGFSYIYSCTDGLIEGYLQSGIFYIDGIAPNPASEAIEVYYRLSGGAPTEAVISIEDAIGRIIMTDRVALQPGANIQHVRLNNIPSGVYCVRISGTAFGESRKFVRE